MLLESISFENYKAFDKKRSLRIRPITILIGKNSSGKSVLSRLPLLVARSLSDQARSPIDLAFDGLDFGSSTIDLIHNRAAHGAVGIGADFCDEPEGSEGAAHKVSFFATVQHF